MVAGRMPGGSRTVNLGRFKEALRRRLPASSPVLSDLLQEPDAMPADSAAVLVPHYLRRLERELGRKRRPRASQSSGLDLLHQGGNQGRGRGRVASLTLERQPARSMNILLRIYLFLGFMWLRLIREDIQGFLTFATSPSTFIHVEPFDGFGHLLLGCQPFNE